MDFTDVLMLKIWPILADTDINIGAPLFQMTATEYSLFFLHVSMGKDRMASQV